VVLVGTDNSGNVSPPSSGYLHGALLGLRIEEEEKKR
jgi:hypothetical protein